MQKKSAVKILLCVLIVAVAATCFSCGFSENVAFAAELPASYTSQWFDSAEYLDTENSIASVNAMLNSMTEADKTELKNNPIILAVIDTGINLSHEVFKGLLYQNTAEIADNGIDDDGNGFIDDVCGWDFVKADNDPSDEASGDKDSHGTHVCGIAALEIIKYGLQDYIKILPIRAGSTSGSFGLTNSINAVDYAIKMNADVINMSFRYWISVSGWNVGGSLDKKIQSAYQHGAVIVAAAGNDKKMSGVSASTASPAAFTNVIGVMGYNISGERYSNSNYGAAYDVIAPAASILSAVRDEYKIGLSDGYIKGEDGDGYAVKNGTSMASPLVAFQAAVLMIRFGRNNAVVTDVICNHSTKTVDEKVSDDVTLHYNMACLSDYMAYSPIMKIEVEQTKGGLSQNISAVTELAFSAKVWFYDNVNPADDANNVYSEITYYVQKFDLDGNLSDDVIASGTGKTFSFTPSVAGTYKLYAKIERNNEVSESNMILLSVNYANVSDVVLTVEGSNEVRAESNNVYTVNNYDQIDPSTNKVVWFIYKDGVSFGTSVTGATLNFAPTETGDYRIVCRMESNGVITTLDEINVKVSISKEKVDTVVGGVTSAVIIAVTVGVLILALAMLFRKKKI